MDVSIGVLASIGLLVLIAAYFSYQAVQHKDGGQDLQYKLDDIVKRLDKLEAGMRDEFRYSREESTKAAKEGREELSSSMKTFSDSLIKQMGQVAGLQKTQFELFGKQLTALTESTQANLDKMTKTLDQKLTYSQQQLDQQSKANREELRKLMETTERKLEDARKTMETKLTQLQQENTQKLEKMRETVDEKLQSTLEKRLHESFKTVSLQLEQVHKGLGEMQTLATGVGDLKKVLSNVKTRGILGEIQLSNILEQIMSPEQYEKNVVVKTSSREAVEFVIKMPGKDDGGKPCYLPLDSKFPLDKYHILVEAYDKADTVAIEKAILQLDQAIKKSAKDIREKYIEPPATTDFAIMFLPTEGLYAEIVRRTDLVSLLQRDYKVIVTGPTTLAAFLNSLQMGFKTLQIERRSSEVWNVLAAVKTEFDKFGTVLEKAQDKINQASKDLDVLVGTRTRQIQSKLRTVHELPATEVEQYLEDTIIPDVTVPPSSQGDKREGLFE